MRCSIFWLCALDLRRPSGSEQQKKNLRTRRLWQTPSSRARWRQALGAPGRLCPPPVVLPHAPASSPGLPQAPFSGGLCGALSPSNLYRSCFAATPQLPHSYLTATSQLPHNYSAQCDAERRASALRGAARRGSGRRGSSSARLGSARPGSARPGSARWSLLLRSRFPARL